MVRYGWASGEVEAGKPGVHVIRAYNIIIGRRRRWVNSNEWWAQRRRVVERMEKGMVLRWRPTSVGRYLRNRYAENPKAIVLRLDD